MQHARARRGGLAVLVAGPRSRVCAAGARRGGVVLGALPVGRFDRSAALRVRGAGKMRWRRPLALLRATRRAAGGGPPPLAARPGWPRARR